MRKPIFVAVLAFFALAVAAQEAPKPAAPPAHTIKMSAKKYEYTPSEIHVMQGERVRLLITATDHKHGIEIKELGIKSDLDKGEETVVEFTADRPGTYTFKCSRFCGFGHRRMKGTLVVEPAPTPSAKN